MLKKLIKYFSKDIPRGRVIHMQDHTSWGDVIHWSNWPELKVHGHMRPRIKPGDILTCDFVSGDKLEFQFTSVDYCLDPRDQFFGKVKYIGVTNENS
ncbi:hypothetical protein OAP32_00450 [Crocinitomicaceae bacterium]|nr:hypothetical protein [Crocinitomicaceae bacterium]